MYFCAAPVFVLFVSVLPLSVVGEGEHRTSLKTLTPEEAQNSLEAKIDKHGLETTVSAKDVSRSLPQDSGANYGDLIHRRYREDGDVLLLREVVVIDELSPVELVLQWSARLNARRISSVRVLNIGRERAFCYRIELTVGAADARAYIRVPPNYDPRILIEVYGF